MRSPTSVESSSIAADGCAEHALAPFDGQVRPRQQLDVRAVRGQRRPQLVRGVRDQLLLSLLRLVEGCEHRVEVGREACQLVPAAHRDPPVEVARRAHLAHRPGERTHRAQHRIRGQSSEQARRERPAERQTEQQPADAGDRRVRLGQRAHGPHQPVARRQAVASCTAASPRPAKRTSLKYGGESPLATDVVVADQGHEAGQRLRSSDGRKLGDDLEEAGRVLAEQHSARPSCGRTWQPDAPCRDGASARCSLRPTWRRRLGRLDQRDVDLVVQLRAHVDVDHRRRDRERDEHGAAPGERQARAQAHGSRSA